MNDPNPQRVAELRALITDFLTKRRDEKLEKLTPDDPKRIELLQQFIPANWLGDAARRAGQIQAVTHSLKPVHPDAKGTNLYSPPSGLSAIELVGTHCLGDNFAGDVVGNAAALDVYKFLKLSLLGRSFLEMACAGDVDLAAVLSDDPAKASDWMTAFASLTDPRGQLTSHTLAKQLYWPIGNDPHDNASYHLLSPLYASSLAHRVFEALQDDRFGETAKAAREARKVNAFNDRPVREYPQLAIQQLGGTKPQNISQLNSERRGNNSLLASLPPVWRSVDLKPLPRTESLFPSFSRLPEVRASLKALLTFLKTDPKRNLETRNTRAAMVDELTDAFLQFAAELKTLEPGWSQTPQCHLGDAECRWLDPEGVAKTDAELERPAPTDIAERISAAFANWLNGKLRDPLPMGDPEFLAWREAMLAQIKAEEREGAYAD
ncbi:MAG: type I-F CRISPR-associated protein Csy1 [Candidatus Saccharibacteria bacterium]|nr:type I-F CRISPR-associated protein Csy1 [Rhodoferax sp.]